MIQEKPTLEMAKMMKIIKENGGTDCSGTCHHRKPGEFHCHALGSMLGISSDGVKKRILKMINMGLMDRKRIEREGVAFPLVKFNVTPEGEKVMEKLLGES